MKNYLSVMLLVMCLLAAPAFAGPYRAEDIEDIQQTYADTPLALTRLMLDLHLSYFERNAVKCMDIRISPLIRAENHFEVPVEMSLTLTGDQIPLALRGLEESSGGKMTSMPRSINVSTTAENTPAGNPVMMMTVNVSFHNNIGAGYDNSLQKAFVAFAKVTTFTPQIKKAATQAPGNKDKNPAMVNTGTWITNMRIDSDKRMQLTGYATEARLVNQLCRELEKTGAFSELWLSSMTRNVYEKQLVVRFDVNGLVTPSIESENK